MAAISKEEAKKLLDARKISEATYNSIPEQKLVTDPNIMSTDSPAIDIQGMQGKEQANAGLAALGQIGAKVVGATVENLPNAATVTSTQQSTTPVFADPQMDMKALKSEGEATKEALDTAGNRYQEIMSPVSKEAMQGAKETGITPNEAVFVKSQLDDSDTILMKSEQLLTDLANKAKINPTEYIDDMSQGTKTMTLIALALGGASGGVTGQGNQALQVLEKRIQDNIKAQEGQLKNFLAASSELRGVAKDRMALAGESMAVKTAAQIIELTKHKAQLEFAEKYASSETQKQQIALRKFEVQKQLTDRGAQFDELRKGMITSGYGDSMNLLGRYFNDYMGLGLGSRPMDISKPLGKYGLGINTNISASSNASNKQEVKKPEPKQETKPKDEKSAWESIKDGFFKGMTGL